jgi:glycosyltransferase involved in cell wall biosynthesis
MENNKKEISVVIPAYNAKKTIEQLLVNLQNQSIVTDRYEIIVVDDGSTDNTVNIIQKFEAVILLHQEHGGPGLARMKGVARAEGELVMFLDSDLDVGPGFLEGHLTFLTQHPEISATGGSVAEVEKSAIFSWKLVDHLSSWYNVHPSIVYKSPPEYLPSLNFCVRKSIFSQHGLSWADGRTYKGEDVVFCHNLRKNNFQIAFLPNVTVKHHDRSSFKLYLQHMFGWGHHAPFVRGQLPELSYGFLFPNSFLLLFFTAPFIVFGYTFLIWKSWAQTRFFAVSLSLPQIFIGRIAYLFGVISGTLQKTKMKARQKI